MYTWTYVYIYIYIYIHIHIHTHTRAHTCICVYKHPTVTEEAVLVKTPLIVRLIKGPLTNNLKHVSFKTRHTKGTFTNTALWVDTYKEHLQV